MDAFVELQKARHEADYDTSSTWNRVDVLTKIRIVRGAFEAWGRVKGNPNSTVFRAALLLQKHWGK
jgi:hypothetical protein